MSTEITQVNVTSVAKFGAALSAIITAVFMLPMLLFGSMMTAMAGGADMGMGFLGSLIAYVLAVVFAAVVSAIGFAIYALVYNVVAEVSGGIRVETA
ncbi:MAG: hypothetical protein ABEH40_03295 [Haloferacaceae archaeon]